MRLAICCSAVRIDPDAGLDLALTPEQASTHTWKPDAATWDKIKHLSVNSPARITIKGLAAGWI